MRTLLRVASNTNAPFGAAKEAEAQWLEQNVKASAFRCWPVTWAYNP